MTAADILARHGYRLLPGDRPNRWHIDDPSGLRVVTDGTINDVVNFVQIRFSGPVPNAGGMRMP